MSDDSNIISLQASIAGYGQPDMSLMAVFAAKSGKLLVISEADFTASKKPGAVKVSNIMVSDLDILFREDDLRESIMAFKEISAMNNLRFEAAAQRHSPASQVQVLKISETGTSYELMQTLKSGHVAALALCWLAKKQLGFASMADFGKRVQNRLYEARII